MTTFSLKEAKEAFVTGFEGTSPAELLLVCASAPIGIWCFQYFCSPSRTRNIFIEILCLWIPMIVCETRYLYPFGLLYLAVQVMLSLLNQNTSSDNDVRKENSKTKQIQDTLTCYRSSLMYLTMIGILAVDFHVFPRRFAKTETLGYSLMDLGAASFIVSAGFVSSRARQMQCTNGKRQRGSVSLSRLAARIAPLVLIGSLRLLTHKQLEYQEHVSEYGVHWNFFFTLAVVLPLGSIVLPGPGWKLPCMMLGIYQMILLAGVQSWVLEAPRHCLESENTLCRLFAANREGILGCIGYMALFLMSEWFGAKYIWNIETRILDQAKFIGVLIVLWQAFVAAGISVSRRTTNAPFIVWVLLFNIIQLTSIQLACHKQIPPIMVVVNRNGLSSFIISNLMTGAINLSINTLEASNQTALIILFLYLSLLSIIISRLDVLLARYQKISNGKKE